jgi:2-polyprenyl-6-methoxyphenol hydroxylase-like FAD-dependent oxidoreductase
MTRESASKNYPLGDRAIILGAGIAGLSAARAVSDAFRQVVILDRDELPHDLTPRNGVPQGKHPHALLTGGLKALEDLFPGFGDDLKQMGAVPLCPTYDLLTEMPGIDEWPRIKDSRRTYSMSRPLIECTLRSRVKRLSNVSVLDGCRVIEIVSHPRTEAAIGIFYRTSGNIIQTLPADLIVDASGNGSLTLDFLKTIGRTAPEETKIGVNMRYASAIFSGVEIKDNYVTAYTLPDAPDGNAGGLILAGENETFQVVMIGRASDVPPLTETGFLRYARDLWSPTISSALKNAKFLSQITPYSFSESKWRHFKQVPDFPRGLLPIGDVICRFNPVYGQGMSSAARQAGLLCNLLGSSQRDSLSNLAPDFLTEVENLVTDPWEMSAVPDFVYP